ncbi:MAG: ABC transporter ATP-binding protein [Ignavibacteria bacterium]|nr:ABC transporter ATP-binding protein [Ignavibacteria bacterium]
MPPEIVLQTQRLSKRFKQRWAVRDLNLEILQGDVFGFLGPNGAGKSTTIRMLLSLIRPTSGDIRLFDEPLTMSQHRALRRVGGIVEKPDFYLYLSAVRNLEIVGALYGGVDRRRMMEVLELVGLKDRAFDRVKTYSHGMKQRLGIAQALLSDPELVILDEPTSGLDPQGMKEVRDLIIHLARDQRKTIFLSSHLLSEIELVANRMAIINRGELVVQGEVSRLLEEGEQYVMIRAEPLRKARAILRRLTRFVHSMSEAGESLKVVMSFDDIPAVNRSLVRSGVAVHAIVPRRSLEDYFLALTEQSLSDGPNARVSGKTQRQ